MERCVPRGSVHFEASGVAGSVSALIAIASG